MYYGYQRRAKAIIRTPRPETFSKSLFPKLVSPEIKSWISSSSVYSANYGVISHYYGSLVWSGVAVNPPTIEVLENVRHNTYVQFCLNRFCVQWERKKRFKQMCHHNTSK